MFPRSPRSFVYLVRMSYAAADFPPYDLSSLWPVLQPYLREQGMLLSGKISYCSSKRCADFCSVLESLAIQRDGTEAVPRSLPRAAGHLNGTITAADVIPRTLYRSGNGETRKQNTAAASIIIANIRTFFQNRASVCFFLCQINTAIPYIAQAAEHIYAAITLLPELSFKIK